jgi:thiamine-monophosphate kinase
MPLSEFTLIQRYFANQPQARADVALGIGDDCALLRVPASQVLAVTLDTLVAGVHFFTDTDPESLGHKALAVNLSDLAAMGAEPAWATLALTLPEADEAWLTAFCRSLFVLAERFGVELVGGDTTQGPLTITLQAHGFVPEGMALRRDGARPGDVICVTGTPGDAGLVLEATYGRAVIPAAHRAYLQARLERPTPRIRQGLELRGLANAAIDISDGLAQDLGHILERSGVGACLNVDRLPRSPALLAYGDQEMAIVVALAGGDDYELCFTVPPQNLDSVQKLAADWDCGCTAIGFIESQPGLRCQYENGSPYRLVKRGYEHFA